MTTALIVYTRNRSEMRNQSIFEQLYRRFEYVLTIIASQGNNILRLNILQGNIDLYNILRNS